MLIPGLPVSVARLQGCVSQSPAAVTLAAMTPRPEQPKRQNEKRDLPAVASGFTSGHLTAYTPNMVVICLLNFF